MARPLTRDQDAYGAAMWDFLHKKGGEEIVEREDGFVGTSSGPAAYFAEYKDWPRRQQEAIALARGRVLDIGCGPGRVALYLQGKGHEAIGIDVSPLAIQVARKRGLKKAKVLSITQITRNLGTFDTIVMYGNNFGLFGSFKRARWLLKRFHAITGKDARILAESNDPYATTFPCHLEYHKMNRGRGRMAGQIRIRIRYQKSKAPWFDYLLVSREEMRQILEGTGWRVERFFESGGSAYIAVIVKE